MGGPRGAAQIAALLQQRGVALDFVIDEGLLVLDGVVPGVKQPTALVGVAEKGYMSVVLKIAATPGHAMTFSGSFRAESTIDRHPHRPDVFSS